MPLLLPLFEKLGPVPHTWQNSLLNAAVVIAELTVCLPLVLLYTKTMVCKSTKCRANGCCEIQYGPKARMAWCIVAYGVEVTAIHVGMALSGHVAFDLFMFVPLLGFGLSILALGVYLVDRTDRCGSDYLRTRRA
jgi:hypothetical protein